MERIIFFDEHCVLCNSSVKFIYAKDKNKLFCFASLQSNFAKDKLDLKSLKASPAESFVLKMGDTYYQKSNAALQICWNLPLPWKLSIIFWLVPKFIRDWTYSYIAKNRIKWFGRQEECMLVTHENKHRFLLD